MTVAAGSITLLPHHYPPNLPHTQISLSSLHSILRAHRQPAAVSEAQLIISTRHHESSPGDLRVWHSPCRGMQCVCFCMYVCVCMRACAQAYMCVPARLAPSTLTASDRYGRLEVGCAAVTRRLPGSRSAVSLSRGRRGHSCPRQALFHHMRRRDSVALAL